VLAVRAVTFGNPLPRGRVSSIHRVAVAAVLLVVTALRSSGAQLTDTASAAAIARLATGAHVRVAWPDGSLLSGRLVGRTPASLILSDGNVSTAVALAELTGVWVASGRATGGGAHVGAVAFGVAGGVLGFLVGSIGCERNCGRARAGATVTGIASGAALGAVTGAAIGTIFPHWERVAP
jgi:hypothetical protein